MTKEISIYQNEGIFAKCVEMGNAFHASGMFGTSKGNEGAAQGVVLAIECFTTGMTPTQILRKYHLIKCRLSPRTDWIQSEFMKRGGKIIWKKWDKEEARAIFVKDGQEIEYSYTFEEAKEDGICFGYDGNTLKDNWKSSRPDMLRARICKKAIKMLDPSIEIDDEDEPNISKQEIDLAAKLEEKMEQAKESGKTLFNEGTKKQAETKAKKDASEVIEAELVEEDAKEEKAEEGPESDEKEPKPKEDPLEEVPKEENPAEGEKHSQESKGKATLELLEEKEDSVNKFLIAKNMIPEGKTFRDLPDNKLKMIEGRIAKGTFFDSVEKFIKTEKGA